MSRINILDLDEDCLADIFKYLPIKDLLTIRQTHPIFLPATKYLLSVNYKTFDFTDDVLLPILYPLKRIEINAQNKKLSLEQTDIVLRFIGKNIQTLSINRDSFDPSITSGSLLGLIKKYCGETLNDLRIFKFLLEDRAIDRLSGLFKNLKKITLHECSTDDYTLGKCLSYCNELKELKIVGVTGVLGFFLLRVPSNLQIFMLKSMRNFEQKYICELFERNAVTLEIVKIIDCHFHGDGLYDSMPKSLKKLSTLFIRSDSIFNQSNLDNLLKFNNLRHLDINVGIRNPEQFLNKLAARITIECLGISLPLLHDQTCIALGQLNLKLLKLTLTRRLHAGSATNLVMNIPTVQTLNLIQCNLLTVDDICDIVANAMNLKNLAIINCKEMKFFRQEDFSRLIGARKQLNLVFSLNLRMKQSAVRHSKCLIDCDFITKFQSVIRFKILSKDSFYEITTDNYINVSDDNEMTPRSDQVIDMFQLFSGSYDDHFFPGFYLSVNS